MHDCFITGLTASALWPRCWGVKVGLDCSLLDDSFSDVDVLGRNVLSVLSACSEPEKVKDSYITGNVRLNGSMHSKVIFHKYCICYYKTYISLCILNS